MERKQDILDFLLDTHKAEGRVEYLRKLWVFFDKMEKATLVTQQNRDRGMEQFIGLAGQAAALKDADMLKGIADTVKHAPIEIEKLLDQLNDTEDELQNKIDEIDELQEGNDDNISTD